MEGEAVSLRCRLRATVCATAAAVAWTTATPLWAQARELPAATAPGDLIFRRGTEHISHLVNALDQGDYSHVGLLVGGPGRWQVLHATPSEKPGQPDAVVLDELAFFTAPQRSLYHVVYHVQDRAPASRQRAVQWALQQVGRPFHMTDARQGIYCTTLVWEAWQQAGLDLQVQFTKVTLPLIAGAYLMPGALAASPHLRKLPAPRP